MSGSSAKIVPEINLDEFERRLRAAGAPPAGAEDPLAELTRLVNAVHADARRATRPASTETPPMLPSVDEAPEIAPPESPPMPPPPPFAAGLRPGFAEPEFEADHAGELIAEPEPAVSAGDARPRQSRGWRFKVGGMIVVGVALLAGAAAIKHGVPGLPKAPPFIAADEAPTKVQPPSEANVQTNGDIAALLMKDSATSTPVKVVNTEEQPVDLRTQTTPAPTPSASAGLEPAAAPKIDAASPVGAAPDTPIVPPAAASASVAPLFPAAKPVKTVSVRPDGSLIASADESAPAAATAPPSAAAAPTPPTKVAVRAIDPVVATPEAATPKLDLPTKLSPPKPQQRTVAKTDTTAPDADASATPSAPLPFIGPIKPSKPAKPAAKTIDAAATDNAPPADAAPALASPPATPPAVAAIKPSAAAPAGEGGAWVVQLAAPRSEADAQSAIARLKKKFPDVLADAELSVHQAEVKGETIYRVRATGFSKGEAGALCAKLKAGGGDCFIAKD